MKKIIALALVLVLAFALASCTTPTQYDEFMAAEVGSTVTIEAYVQGHQSWWDNKLTVYLQDENGGYFAYDMECTEAQADQIEIGTKIKVTGKKAEWAGEIEIYNPCTLVEIIEGDTWVAPVTDVTAKMGTDELIDYMNRKVSFKDLEVIDYGLETYAYVMPMSIPATGTLNVEVETTVNFTFVNDENFSETIDYAILNADEVDAALGEGAADAMLSQMGGAQAFEGTYVIEDGQITLTVEVDGETSTSPAQSFAKGTDDDGAYIEIDGQKLYKVASPISYDPDKSDSDIYFKAKDANGNVVEFCVEYYLTNDSTDTYQAALDLKVGDTIDIEGFLYWYNGANPHVTKIAD